MKACTILCTAISLLFIIGCSHEATTEEKLPSFVVTNRVVDGKLRQVIEVTNGLSLYFTTSYITVWFCEGAATVIGVDPKTLRPKGILLDVPLQVTVLEKQCLMVMQMAFQT